MWLVKSGALSQRKASAHYGIPLTTLNDKLNNRSAIGTPPGPATILTTDEEDHLASWVINMSRVGYGLTREEICQSVQKIMQQDGRQNPFRDGKPSKDWWYGFIKRNKNLSVRSPLQLGKERAIKTREKVNQWFDLFEAYIKEQDASLLLEEPSRWFNADKTGHPLCPKSSRVVAEKEASVVYNFESSHKIQLTVMACVSAVGVFVPPMIVIPWQRFTYDPLAGFPEAVLGRS